VDEVDIWKSSNAASVCYRNEVVILYELLSVTLNVDEEDWWVGPTYFQLLKTQFIRHYITNFFWAHNPTTRLWRHIVERVPGTCEKRWSKHWVLHINISCKFQVCAPQCAVTPYHLAARNIWNMLPLPLRPSPQCQIYIEAKKAVLGSPRTQGGPQIYNEKKWLRNNDTAERV